MRFRSLTLVVTDDCNFNCVYCYKRRRGRSMAPAVARRAVLSFLPFFRREWHLNFYGGEPLLEFGLIREIVALAKNASREYGRRPRFSLTTNGSLCDEEVVRFLERHRFSVVLSYDGLGQDLLRARGSGRRLRDLIGRLLVGGRVRLEVNSVFTPATADGLYVTVRELDDLGVGNIRASLSVLKPWSEEKIRALGREWGKARRWAGRVARQGKSVSLANFREDEPERLRYCSAGEDRMAVDTDGRVWGCALFSDWAHLPGSAAACRFSFGPVRKFFADPERAYSRVMPRYRVLSMDRSRTEAGPCFLCPHVAHCGVCPVNAVLGGGSPGVIPSFICRLQKARLRHSQNLTSPRRRPPSGKTSGRRDL